MTLFSSAQRNCSSCSRVSKFFSPTNVPPPSGLALVNDRMTVLIDGQRLNTSNQVSAGITSTHGVNQR